MTVSSEMLVLAPGVSFDEANHKYWYRGRKLSGITGLIAKRLGIHMPEEFVGEYRDEGVHVHKAVQRWVETGDAGSVHPGVQWIIHTLKPQGVLYSEVLVSDLKQYASSVDLVSDCGSVVHIADIKTGRFRRDYVTWQLSIYKYFIERYTGKTVGNCYCICTKDREMYPIFPVGNDTVEGLLYTF